MSYEVSLANHIAAAVLWVGGAVAMIVRALRIARTRATSQVADFGATFERLGKFYSTTIADQAALGPLVGRMDPHASLALTADAVVGGGGDGLKPSRSAGACQAGN